MRLPSWVHSRTTTRVAGKVTITLTADTSGFEAAMWETASIVRFHRAVAQERSCGRAYVGSLLDNLASSVGLDPVQTWRLPRARDERLAGLNHPDRGHRVAAERAWLIEHRAHRGSVADGH